MSSVFGFVPNEKTLTFLGNRLLTRVKRRLLNDLVESELERVKKILIETLEPEIDKLTLEEISAAEDFYTNRINLLVRYNTTKL